MASDRVLWCNFDCTGSLQALLNFPTQLVVCLLIGNVYNEYSKAYVFYYLFTLKDRVIGGLITDTLIENLKRPLNAVEKLYIIRFNRRN